MDGDGAADVSQARVGLAEKRKDAYISKDRAAATIQRWYRSFKTVHSSAPNSSEDSITETDNSLDDFVNNEVAIALALANQRPLSSLTESQREKVRQLRAQVAPKENNVATETTNISQKSKTSRLKPPSIYKVRKKEMGATSMRAKNPSQANLDSSSSNLRKRGKLREPLICVRKRENNGVNAMEKCKQVVPLSKENSQQENLFKKQQVQSAEQQESNTEKKSHQQRQNGKEATTFQSRSNGFRDHPSKIPMPIKQPPQLQLPKHIEYDQQEDIDFIQLGTDEKIHPVRNEKIHQTKWDVPETPKGPRLPPPKKRQKAVKRLKLHPPPSHDSDYLQEKDFGETKQLINNEQAQALIDYAQELVIKDFLAWKGGSLSAIPINEHQRKLAPRVPWDKTTPAPTNVDYEIKSNKLDNKTSQTQANRFPPIIESLTPHLTPTHTPTMMSLRLSSVRRNHEPKSKGTMATNKAPAPPMSDIAIQTDSIDVDDDILTILSAITLPPISDRLHNQGENSRHEGENGKKFEKKGSFTEARNRRVGPRNQPFKDKKDYSMHYNERNEKKPLSLKSLRSPPPLRQSQRKQAGGYLTKFLHSNSSGHLPTKSAPGGYYQASSANQLAPRYEDLHYTAPPSIISGDSPIHLNRSHPVPSHMRRKFSNTSGPYRIHSRRLHERLKPIQGAPADMYPPTTNQNNDPFKSLDSMYQHQYRKNSQRKL